MGKLGTWVVAAALCVGCSQGRSTVTQVTPDAGSGGTGSGGGGGGVDAGGTGGGTGGGSADAGNGGGSIDAGPVDAGGGSVDAGHVDAGGGGTGNDGGSDAGTPADGGAADAGTQFGGPGPWPITNEIYGAADGILESPVVGVSTDETQNLWVATNSALYLRRPGDAKFTRFDATTGSADAPDAGGVGDRLHLQSNPVQYCDGWTTPCTPSTGAAADPGISEIVGGGPNEVFVGYYGFHNWNDPNDGTWSDPYRHTGHLDRVRLVLDADGSVRDVQVVRLDISSNNTAMFWHNRTIERMIYDHFKHPHELYLGTDHGVDKLSPDKWKPNVGWFLAPTNEQVWMSDHLHPRACYHAPCVDDSNQRLGDWRGLALDSLGDLWVGGRWAAGAIVYTADNSNWYNNPRSTSPYASAFKQSFGDPYTYCDGGRPVFCPPQEGDFVNLSAVAVTKDPLSGGDRIWFSSGIVYGDAADVNYGVAAFVAHPGPGGQVWTYFDPVNDIGMAEMNVRDMLALPDGRLVFAGPNTGLVIWDPIKRTHVSIRAGQGIPDDHVLRLEVDTMVNPPALHVSTWGGAAVLRQLP